MIALHDDEDLDGASEGLGAAMAQLGGATCTRIDPTDVELLPASLREQIRGDWIPLRAVVAIWKHRDALLAELAQVDEICGLHHEGDLAIAIDDRVEAAIARARREGEAVAAGRVQILEREVSRLRARDLALHSIGLDQQHPTARRES